MLKARFTYIVCTGKHEILEQQQQTKHIKKRERNVLHTTCNN